MAFLRESAARQKRLERACEERAAKKRAESGAREIRRGMTMAANGGNAAIRPRVG